MVRVGVLFELQFAETLPGEGICVSGNRPELGAWALQPAKSVDLHLRTSAFMYPRWAMLRPLWLELPTDGTRIVRFEYKYIIDRRMVEKSSGMQTAWENRMWNREVELPVQDGSIWLLSDESWGDSAVPPSVRSIAMDEVAERWNSFDPDWLPAVRRQPSAPLVPAAPAVPHFLLSPEVEPPSPRSHGDPEHAIVEEFGALANDTSEAIAALQTENAMLRERLRNLSAIVDGQHVQPEASDGRLSALPPLQLQKSQEEHSTKEDATSPVSRLGARDCSDAQRSCSLAQHLQVSHKKQRADVVSQASPSTVGGSYAFESQTSAQSTEAESWPKHDVIPSTVGGSDAFESQTSAQSSEAESWPKHDVIPSTVGGSDAFESQISAQSSEAERWPKNDVIPSTVGGSDAFESQISSQSSEAERWPKNDIIVGQPHFGNVSDDQLSALLALRLQRSGEECYTKGDTRAQIRSCLGDISDAQLNALLSKWLQRSSKECCTHEDINPLARSDFGNISHNELSALLARRLQRSGEEYCVEDKVPSNRSDFGNISDAQLCAWLALRLQSSEEDYLMHKDAIRSASRSGIGDVSDAELSAWLARRLQRSEGEYHAREGFAPHASWSGKGAMAIADAQLSALLARRLRRSEEVITGTQFEEDHFAKDISTSLTSRPGAGDNGISDAQLGALLARRLQRSDKQYHTSQDAGVLGEHLAKEDLRSGSGIGDAQLSALLAKQRQKLEGEGAHYDKLDLAPSSHRPLTGDINDAELSAVLALRRQKSDGESTVSSLTSRPGLTEAGGSELSAALAKRRQKLEEQRKEKQDTTPSTFKPGTRDVADTQLSALLAMQRQKVDGGEPLGGGQTPKRGGFFRRRWLQSPGSFVIPSAKTVDEPQEEPGIQE